MKEKLLSDWKNRPSGKWGEDPIPVWQSEIAILSALQNAGCETTEDKLPIKKQMDERKELIQTVLLMQHGII